MSSSVATARRPSEVKTRDLPLMGETPNRQPAVNCDDGRWILEELAAAIDAHMQRKEAAYLMKQDAAQLSRQLSADGHLSLLRTGSLPEPVWLELAERIKAHFGKGDPEAERKRIEEDAVRAVLRLVQAR